MEYTTGKLSHSPIHYWGTEDRRNMNHNGET